MEHGIPVQNIMVADMGYPIVTEKVIKVYVDQAKDVHNGCIVDRGVAYAPCAKTGNYWVHLLETKSLKETSKVETIHSIKAKHFYQYNNIRPELFNTHALWCTINYDRIRLIAQGLFALEP
jgi:hypothetical protein